MKKYRAIALAAILCLSLAACGAKEHVHSFGSWSVVQAATCTEAGQEHRCCTCGEEERRDIPAAGHSFGEWVVIKEATCLEFGLKEHTCSVCGATETTDI